MEIRNPRAKIKIFLCGQTDILVHSLIKNRNLVKWSGTKVFAEAVAPVVWINNYVSVWNNIQYGCFKLNMVLFKHCAGSREIAGSGFVTDNRLPYLAFTFIQVNCDRVLFFCFGWTHGLMLKSRKVMVMLTLIRTCHCRLWWLITMKVLVTMILDRKCLHRKMFT